MRKILLSILILCYSSTKSQIISITYLLGNEKTFVKCYSVDTSIYMVPLAMKFGSNNFLTDTNFLKIQKSSYPIKRIDYVYSKHKNQSSFSQARLDSLRYLSLKEKLPFLFDNNLTKWKTIEQSDFTSEESAKKLFHGFVVYFKKPALYYDSIKEDFTHELSTEEEIDFILKILGTRREDTAFTKILDVAEKREYIPRSKRKAKKGITYKKRSIWNRELEVYPASYLFDTSLVYFNFKHNLMDTIVLKSFSEFSDWQNTLIVEDVTGSMYPYITQTFIWRRLNKNLTNSRYHTFFNDGDSNPDGPVGNSYGAYFIESTKIKAVEDKVYQTMRKGNGGGSPENDIEAMLRGLKKFQKCEQIVLVCDNNSPVRDLALLKKIDVPVHVVLCGYYNRAMYHYIKIAAETGGSLSTMEFTLDNFDGLKRGDSFTIGSQRFKMEDDRLILIR